LLNDGITLRRISGRDKKEIANRNKGGNNEKGIFASFTTDRFFAVVVWQPYVVMSAHSAIHAGTNPTGASGGGKPHPGMSYPLQIDVLGEANPNKDIYHAVSRRAAGRLHRASTDAALGSLLSMVLNIQRTLVSSAVVIHRFA